ncbi:unnamed protein product, partial [Boreogadus saida]
PPQLPHQSLAVWSLEQLALEQLPLGAMNENCWDCIGPQLQHPFSFCGSELVIFKVYLIVFDGC